MPPLLPISLNDDEPKRLSLTRKLVLLVMLCLTQFIDTLNMSALLSAIPALEASMGMTEIQSTWVFSGFRLTFASFLLIVRAHPVNPDSYFNALF
jgi:MFS family permease